MLALPVCKADLHAAYPHCNENRVPPRDVLIEYLDCETGTQISALVKTRPPRKAYRRRDLRSTAGKRSPTCLTAEGKGRRRYTFSGA
jgi:hypothetical protein